MHIGEVGGGVKGGYEGRMIDKTELSRITSNPEICGGRPCIRGTRMRVTDLLELLANGVSHREILEDFPYLEDADIAAALLYAAEQTSHPVTMAAE